MHLKRLSFSLFLSSALLILPSQSLSAWAAPTFRAVVPTSEKASQSWKYTFVKPPTKWQGKDFNDSKWKTGPGGFGTKGTPRIGKLGTVWKTPDIWLRRTFNPGTLTPAQIAKMGVRDYHDETVEVYINGALAYFSGGYTTGYERRPLSLAARRALLSNAQNVIAVHCHQTAGGQYIDVGLEQVTSGK